jgi:dTDP-4-amino-4,6-dideoxygalactose transaminase
MATREKNASFQPRTFVQTAQAAIPELDRWVQITEDEVEMVADMTRRNEISGGTPTVRQFEKEWSEWIGTRFCVTTVNGTSSLYSAYFGLGVGPGDEVICPINTWICTIAPVPLLGARPVFCDIDPETLMIDPASMEACITPNTRCIVPVHLWGNICDLDAIMAITRKHKIPVIEDVSHAHGASYKGKMCGAIGEVGCWSLQGSKPISAGEGGVLTTDDIETFERACLVGQVNRIQGIDLVRPKYKELQPLGLGMKFRAHPLGIGIAQVQLRKLAVLNDRRRAFVEEIEGRLDQVPGLRPVKVYPGAVRAGFYGFPVIHETEETGISTDDLVAALRAAGIKASKTPYPNLHDLPLFAKGFDIFTRNRGPLCPSNGWVCPKPGDFPMAELAQRRTVFLPCLSDPVPGAADTFFSALRDAVCAAVKR